MNAIPPAAELQAEFLALLAAAARAHAGDVHIRVIGDRAQVMASINGQALAVGDWPATRCESYLTAVHALCDTSDSYTFGSACTARMTGAKTKLPEGVRLVLLQFFAPKEGRRALIARITREGDACCGSCGG